MPRLNSIKSEEYQALSKLIIESELSSEQKLLLTLKISKILIENGKELTTSQPIVEEQELVVTPEGLDSFEEGLIDTEREIAAETVAPVSVSKYRRRQISLAGEKYRKYLLLLPDSPFFARADDTYNTITLEQLENRELDMDKFCSLLVISAFAINVVPVPAVNVTL